MNYKDIISLMRRVKSDWGFSESGVVWAWSINRFEAHLWDFSWTKSRLNGFRPLSRNWVGIVMTILTRVVTRYIRLLIF